MDSAAEIESIEACAKLYTYIYSGYDGGAMVPGAKWPPLYRSRLK